MSGLLFPDGYRASGILLHVTSLPGRYGIGDLGPAAFAWVDRLAAAGQQWWQVLPLGPTGGDNSPYQSMSTFAGNDLLISPDRLVEDGLVAETDLTCPEFSTHEVNFQAVISFKEHLLERAWQTMRAAPPPELAAALAAFRRDQAFWLDDYALFRALKVKYHNSWFLEWPADVVRRDPAALAAARAELGERVDAFSFRQFLFFRQADRLKRYANDKGVRLFGDVPIFVSADSADVWANRGLFQLDGHGRPAFVAGVPPDYFSPDGQLWGNPLYDWEANKRTGYRWWFERLRAVLRQTDVVRIDHFRAFESAWHVPVDAPTARTGEWRAGPRDDFFQAARKEFGTLPFVAEDLGIITDEVRHLRDRFNLPGMLVLQFAWDGEPKNPFVPHNHVHNAVIYTGTHDNDTTLGWYRQLSEPERNRMWGYMMKNPAPDREVPWALIRMAWRSKVALAIAPLQDVLTLGPEARMNVPGKAGGNWGWRATQEMIDDPAFIGLGELTHETGRSPR